MVFLMALAAGISATLIFLISAEVAENNFEI